MTDFDLHVTELLHDSPLTGQAWQVIHRQITDRGITVEYEDGGDEYLDCLTIGGLYKFPGEWKLKNYLNAYKHIVENRWNSNEDIEKHYNEGLKLLKDEE